MRLFALSISAAVLGISTASAQKPNQVNMLEFVHEAQGQAFTPPPIHIEPIEGANPENIIELGDRAKSECATWVAEIYAYRDRIYLACLGKRLEPAGLTVIVLNDVDEIAQRFGVATD